MRNEKMTKKEYFAILKNVVNNSNEQDIVKDELNAFIDHEIELLIKKSNQPKKPTATQKANIELSATIRKIMEGLEKPMTISEIHDYAPELEEYSVQKLTALISRMEGLEKTKEKGKMYYMLTKSN